MYYKDQQPLVKTEQRADYIQLLATKLDRNNGPIKYAKIVEELSNGRVRHTQLINVPLTEKEKTEQRAKDQAKK